MSENPPPPSSAPFSIRRGNPSEAEAIASVIRAAFTTIADAIGIDIPPLHETAAEVLATFSAGDAVFVAETNGVVVGTVRGETMDGGDVMVRRLAVLPAYRGVGIARGLMRALEQAYPCARRFELFTGADATAPVALYESLGYALIEPPPETGVPLVYLEKRQQL
jgi:ribosomal protein S18 acetylase RimI-like enzyme